MAHTQYKIEMPLSYISTILTTSDTKSENIINVEKKICKHIFVELRICMYIYLGKSGKQ